MSHDIFLQRLKHGESGICSLEESQACIDLLAPVIPKGEDPRTCEIITLPNGHRAEVSPGFENDRMTNITFYLRGFSDDMAGFIFSLAQAGDFIILDSGGEDTTERPVAYAPNQAALDRMGVETIENPCLCSNKEQFIQMIKGGYEAWKTYRDFVIK